MVNDHDVSPGGEEDLRSGFQVLGRMSLFGDGARIYCLELKIPLFEGKNRMKRQNIVVVHWNPLHGVLGRTARTVKLGQISLCVSDGRSLFDATCNQHSLTKRLSGFYPATH